MPRKDAPGDPVALAEVAVGVPTLPRQRRIRLNSGMSALARLVLHSEGMFQLDEATKQRLINEVFEMLEEANDAPTIPSA